MGWSRDKHPATFVGALLLLGIGGTGAVAKQPSKFPPAEERGEQLYLENCWHCHGKRGLADGPLAEAGPIAAPALAGRVPSDHEPWMTAIHRGKGTMPAFAPVMDRTAVRAVLTWLEALDPVTGEGPSIAATEAKKAAEQAEAKAEKARQVERSGKEASQTEAGANAASDAAASSTAASSAKPPPAEASKEKRP